MRDEVEQLSKEVERLKKALTERDLALAERELALAERDQAIAKRDAATLEWIQSNEVFKRLARRFRAEAGVGQEAFGEMVAEEMLALAREEPLFSATSLT